MAVSKVKEVTPHQVAILRALEPYMEEGLTKGQIQNIAKVPCTMDNLGPANLETVKNHPKCLWARGYVSAISVQEGIRAVTVYRITDEGIKVVRSIRTKRYSTFYGRIPDEVLDPVVIAYTRTATYGHDNFKEKDIERIKQKLPKEYWVIPWEEVKAQIVGRRKAGAYKKEHPLPEWYTNYRMTTEFLDKQEECLEKYNGKCIINQEHEGDILAYHTRLTTEDGRSIIDNERVDLNDLIPLCESCAMRLRVSLVKFPEKEPTRFSIDLE